MVWWLVFAPGLGLFVWFDNCFDFCSLLLVRGLVSLLLGLFGWGHY